MTTKVEEVDHLPLDNSPAKYGECQPNPDTVQTIVNWLISKISDNLGIDPTCVDANEPLAVYALGSVQSVSLVADLEDWVGQKLPPTLLWDYPTLKDVAILLSRESEGESHI